MRSVLAWTCLVASSFLPAPGLAQDVPGLDGRLLFLRPLMEHPWEGGFVGDSVPDLLISLRFEPVLAGKAVKYTREVAELGYLSETHFYWDPGRQEVLFLSLNSRGIVGQGVVSIQEGAILLQGTDHWPDRAQEFRTSLYIERGRLRDVYTRKEAGEWVPGHIQEFAAKTPSGPGPR